ncbi:ectoine/hydroxyectoine ABC transporter permease subunit EhuC [Streptomyces sp. 549]|uniref:ectoine/hydroxyectoine ABC transporter permease subunit EhuC n=1 Tax=Streptomyces sp. 549 TaxID=3049076 RepID=UPI0024C2F627|nr:ectoine/hydroxyectoine ABC transporter permease subunit EhuC [Streptomyces sp. 549]MDK1473735.1 ectoine/hydroxyectoine ABC transporter permease subunit EhuC [Streptomyces sp. 549]
MTSGIFTNWFLPGIWITIQVTLYSAALAALVAFGIGIARSSKWWIVRFLAGIYFEIFRGTSALVFMLWMAFAFPLMFGWQFVPMGAGVVALGLTYGAYGSEVVRGALQSVATEQREAGIALSFTRLQRLRRIELPQAWPEMIPSFNNLLIELLKGTALVSVISVADMTFAGNLARLASNESAPAYTLLLFSYFVIAFVLTRGMRALERHAKAGIGQGKPRQRGFLSRKLDARGESSQASSQSAGGIG